MIDTVETQVSRAPASKAPVHWLVERRELILVATLWLALVTGLVDASVVAYRKFVLDELVHRSPHFVWMAPLAYVMLFALPGLAIYLGARVAPRFFRPAVALGLLMLGGTVSVLLQLFHPRLHPAALMLLAIGLAAQLGKLAAARLDGFARVVRRSTIWLALLVTVLGAAVGGSRAWAERAAIGSLPSARAGAPNVIFIILDTVRAASMSLYGYTRNTTPNLERWGRAGVVFERALAPSSWTLPSHASMFTGHPPHALSTHWLAPLDGTYATLAEAFHKNGFRTGAFVANLQYATAEMGLDRGFSRYEDYQVSPSQVIVNSTLGRVLTTRRGLRSLVRTDEIVGRKKADDVGRDFLQWTERLDGQPFFAFLNYYDAHDPYLPPDRFYQAIAGAPRPDRLSPLRRIKVRERRTGLSAENQKREVDSYDASIAYLDFELDRLFQELERRGLLRNTLVIISSDHGEEFGEHGLYLHGNDLYLTSLHVPLIVRFPERVPAGVRVAEAVSMTDITATIAELAGLDEARFPGQTLSPLWNGGSRASMPVRSELQKGIRLPDWYPVSAGDMTSLVFQGKQYIRGAQPREELFDWDTDPLGVRNVLDEYERSEVVSYLRRVAVQQQQRAN